MLDDDERVLLLNIQYDLLAEDRVAQACSSYASWSGAAHLRADVPLCGVGALRGPRAADGRGAGRPRCSSAACRPDGLARPPTPTTRWWSSRFPRRR